MSADDLVLENDQLRVVVRPAKGSDIVAIEHRPTATSLLFEAPWSGAPATAPHAPDSFAAWVRAYPGGWQVLFPNAGSACVERGVEWGFHGEAAMVPWTVEGAAPGGAELRVALVTAPIEIERRLELDAGCLTVWERLTNLGADPVEVMWGHHPTFGARSSTGRARSSSTPSGSRRTTWGREPCWARPPPVRGRRSAPSPAASATSRAYRPRPLSRARSSAT